MPRLIAIYTENLLLNFDPFITNWLCLKTNDNTIKHRNPPVKVSINNFDFAMFFLNFLRFGHRYLHKQMSRLSRTRGTHTS